MLDGTLKGLDQSLEDLERAIDSLPDGPTKKLLVSHYQRLREVRENLYSPSERETELLHVMLVLMVAFFLSAFLYSWFRKK